MKAQSYPRSAITPADVLTQATFDLAHAHVMSWQQGAGVFGGLHLHACWSMSGVLPKRYHGQTTWPYHNFIAGFRSIYERTGAVRWRQLVDDCISNLLHLQDPAGGFVHANYQLEPAYDINTDTCPIHQGMPLLDLLDYASWPHADPRRVELIKPAVDRHWEWFERRWWKRGNRWLRSRFGDRVNFPCFCGVTNQDLVIIAALARYARVYGDESRYERFGRPVLDEILSPRLYHAKLGIFERGDQENYVERTFYNEVNIPMLEIVQEIMPEPRIAAAIDNVTAHIFDAVHTGVDGFTHLAWGANTDPADKTTVLGWINTPNQISHYPAMLRILRRHLDRHPSPTLEIKYQSLLQTVAAYTLADGALPVALGTTDPIFTVVPRADFLWSYLIDHLGEALAVHPDVTLPCVERRYRDVTWRADNRQWELVRNGRREYAGLKSHSYAIAIGPDETIAGADFNRLREPNVYEQLEDTTAH